jgi:uncharacterized protein (PEP-CTERM system associated)
MIRRRSEPRRLAIALLVFGALGAQAQEDTAGGPRGGAVVQPRLALTQTWTDNLQLDDRNKDAALVTTLSPGISVLSNSGVLRGSLDYSLHGIAYVKTEQSARVQHALSANGRAELISGRLFVDLRATVGQQNESAFGLLSAPSLNSQESSPYLANENRRETATLSVSPLLRGTLGGIATYDLRADVNRTETRGSNLGDSRGHGGSLRIAELDPGVFGWWLQFSSQELSASSVSSNRSSTARVGLSYQPDPDWFFTLNAGHERSNFLGGEGRNGATAGASAQWTPTPRTQASADWQRYSYGNSHGLTFEHRMSRSVWRLSDVQTTTLGNTGASGGVRTLYDQFFVLFASLEPDPVKRDALVRAYLQGQGLSPDAPLSIGFLSTGPSRLRTQQAGVTLRGVRSSLSAQFSRAITRRLGEGLNQGDLANSARIEQRSYSLSASHQLTPLTGLALTASRMESTGDLSQQSARLQSLTVNLNTRLGPRLNAQLGARHSRFEGVTPYTENAAYASVTQQF